MSVCAKFQPSSWSRSGWKVCSCCGGGWNTWLLSPTPTLFALELLWVELSYGGFWQFETDTETFGRWSQSWRLALRPPLYQSVSRPPSHSSLEKLLDCGGEGRKICVDCYESSKGRLCKNSREIMYVANYLTTEDDVRAMQPKPSIDFDFWKPLLTTLLIPPPK